MRVLLAVFAILIWPAMAAADPARDFCQSAKKDLRDDAKLATAATSVFPRATFAPRDDGCIFPLKVLQYGDADVLMTAGNMPGEGCHGCAASLSAYVLRRAPSGPRLVAKFVDFESAGSSGSVGDINALQIAGHDAFAVEAGGTFQGFTSTQVSFFVFRSGRLDTLNPSLSLSADNAGAVTDETKVISIDGTWHADPRRPDAVTIGYKVKTNGRTNRTSVTWTLDQNQLKLAEGRVPPEFEAASGN